MMPFAISSRNANAAPTMTRPAYLQKVQLDGLGFIVERCGDGPPVLLLHGFPDSLRLWRNVAPLLAAAGFHVVAPDQRGCGDSGAPVGRQHYRMDRLVADMAGLVRTLGIREPVHVMGHDWGAVVAWCMAVTRPEIVSSAVAISVGHPREYALAGLEQKRKGLYTIGWQFPVLAERWLAANDWARMRHWLRQHPDPDSCLRNLARPGRLTAGLNWYRANLLPMLAQPLPDCTVPMLGVWGSEDHCLAEDQMSRSGRRASGPWRYERIDGAGHWLPLEQPGRIASLAIAWFSGPGVAKP
jgi:pimeloyl-ACP methyl ester carboxylesterase